MDDEVCGFNCSTWISLTEETYSFGAYGYQFNGWPDGKPLVEQEQCVVEILKVILMEIMLSRKNG